MTRKPSIKSKGRGVQHSRNRRRYATYHPLRLTYQPADSIENLKKGYQDLFAFVLARKIDPRSAGAAAHCLDGLVRLMVSPELTIKEAAAPDDVERRYRNLLDEILAELPEDQREKILEKWKAEILAKLRGRSD